MWENAIELKKRIPELYILCDPSHISGNRDLIAFISQKALDLDMAGLMIESHINPDAAWSDAKQQVTPAVLGKIISELVVRTVSSENKTVKDTLHVFRQPNDPIDDQSLQNDAHRMKISEQIRPDTKKKKRTI